MLAEFKYLSVDTHDNGVTTVTLSRPDRLNALTFAMFHDLKAVFEALDTDDRTRVIVLTGEGRAFCAGLDLDDAATLSSMSPFEMLRGQESWAASIAAVARVRKPVIAAVNGAAAGAGFSLALAADVRICDQSARFNAAFIKIGLSGGDCGTTWALPRIVGYGHASEILMSGRFVDSVEAARIGLVNRVVPSEELLEAAVEVASSFARNSPLALHLTKELLHQNVDAPSLQAALELENRSQVLASRSSDMTEALRAFREKREPRFHGV